MPDLLQFIAVILQFVGIVMALPEILDKLNQRYFDNLVTRVELPIRWLVKLYNWTTTHPFAVFLLYSLFAPRESPPRPLWRRTFVFFFRWFIRMLFSAWFALALLSFPFVLLLIAFEAWIGAAILGAFSLIPILAVFGISFVRAFRTLHRPFLPFGLPWFVGAWGLITITTTLVVLAIPIGLGLVASNILLQGVLRVLRSPMTVRQVAFVSGITIALVALSVQAVAAFIKLQSN